MSKKIYELYGSDQRVIDNLKRKIRGYKKMRKDITSQNRKVNNQNRKLQQENKKYKEVIEKALKYINSNPNVYYDEHLIDVETLKANETTDKFVGEVKFISKLLSILKEVEHGED